MRGQWTFSISGSWQWPVSVVVLSQCWTESQADPFGKKELSEVSDCIFPFVYICLYVGAIFLLLLIEAFHTYIAKSAFWE